METNMISQLRRKFTSGNTVPVTRTSITDKEYDQLQADWIKRVQTTEHTKKIAFEFFKSMGLGDQQAFNERWETFQEQSRSDNFLTVFDVQLKSRDEMEQTIPRDLWGWWIDVCPGKRLKLRQATETDIERCNLDGNSSKNPKDYYCEIPLDGALVNKLAVKKVLSFSKG